MSQGVGLASCLPKTAWPPTFAIEGLICKAITYTADHESQPVHSAHASVPFSAYIVLPSTTLIKVGS